MTLSEATDNIAKILNLSHDFAEKVKIRESIVTARSEVAKRRQQQYHKTSPFLETTVINIPLKKSDVFKSLKETEDAVPTPVFRADSMEPFSYVGNKIFNEPYGFVRLERIPFLNRKFKDNKFYSILNSRIHTNSESNHITIRAVFNDPRDFLGKSYFSNFDKETDMLIEEDMFGGERGIKMIVLREYVKEPKTNNIELNPDEIQK